MTIKVPPFRLVLEPLSETAAALTGFRWAGEHPLGRKIGQRHKLGGDFDFLQRDEIPSCPNCRKQMTFYGQLGSIGDDVCLADCGMIYVFVCFDCFTTKSFIQSY
jgi:hypothetical protein